MIALNTGMRYSEIRLMQWKQVDFVHRFLTVGKFKTRTGTGRVVPLNERLLGVMQEWAANFPAREPGHYLFPLEKYGARGEEETFGFTADAVVYDQDPTRPIGDWKEAWEKAKERAGAILASESITSQTSDTGNVEGESPEIGNGDDRKITSPPLKCRFHDLRHSAVTRLLDAGVPYPVVASIVGWSASTAIRMSKRYGHIGHQALRDAMETLDGPGSPKKSPKKFNK
jgi:integrase